MSQKANAASPNGGSLNSVPTLALRGGLSGEFVDFHLLPSLLADFDGSPRSAAMGRWAELLVAHSFNARHIDLDWEGLAADVAAIVHWACIDFAHAEALAKDIEINRDVATHRVGVPPDPDLPPGASLERHWERVMEFYSEHPRLGGQVPFSFREELALVKLIGFCGLLREVTIGLACPGLAEA